MPPAEDLLHDPAGKCPPGAEGLHTFLFFSTVEAKWLLTQPQVVELPPCAQKQLLFVYQLWKVQGNVCAGEADSPSEACRQLLCTPPKQRR